VWRHKDFKAQREDHFATRSHHGGCKNLTHTSETRHVKRTQMVVTVMFTIRMFLTFSDWLELNATKLSREKM